MIEMLFLEVACRRNVLKSFNATKAIVVVTHVSGVWWFIGIQMCIRDRYRDTYTVRKTPSKKNG